MALTVGNLYKESEKYKMKLLAGDGGMANLVSWIHIVETVDGAGFLHGNEIVITEGTICRTEEALMKYMEEVYIRNASAVIINTGMFIMEVPSAVILFCNEKKLPLFTVPWEIPLVDLTTDFCKRIVEHVTRQDSIATTFKNLIFHVGDEHMLVNQMERYGYMHDSTMTIVCISLEGERDSTEVSDESRKIKYIAEQSAKKIKDQYISFEYQGKRIVVLFDYSDEEVEAYTDTLFKALSANRLVPYIYIGVGDNMRGLDAQDNNFMRAFVACRIGIKRNEHVLSYKELGLYKLLVNVKNTEVLYEMYQSTLGKLEEHDRENGTKYRPFLDAYIESDGNTGKVSKALYIHRNTVNNYIKKVEEILEIDIMSWENRALLYTSYCIRNIL